MEGGSFWGLLAPTLGRETKGFIDGGGAIPKDRSLLGLANYYHHFMWDLSKVARSLSILLKKWLPHVTLPSAPYECLSLLNSSKGHKRIYTHNM